MIPTANRAVGILFSVLLLVDGALPHGYNGRAKTKWQKEFSVNRFEASEQYKTALRQGQREYKELSAAERDPYPPVLDEILERSGVQTTKQVLPATEIPLRRVVGVKSAGRISAFSAGFLPLLPAESEFGGKWISLYEAQMKEGIRDPIKCYEYLGDFYVEEGNKRVSVLRCLGAASILANVTRLIPPRSDDPRIRAYYEFMDFYQHTGLYEVQFRKPGSYAKLLSLLGQDADSDWTDSERRSFATGYHYFREAFSALGGEQDKLQPEEALLLWLEVYPFEQLRKLGAEELKKSLSGLWSDMVAGTSEKTGSVPSIADPEPKSFLTSIISPDRSHLKVAFVHQRDVERSPWTKAHEQGRRQLAAELGERVTTRSYFNADNPEDAEKMIELAVAEGAEAVFTTTPALLRPTLKVAVKYPKVRFFNCSPDVPFSSVHGYYVRAFEGKFITGAVAGAMAKNGRIGYIASYPILGVPASINAFALGAQMTNPDARIELRWSCCSGDHVREFLDRGIRVVSNRDVPTPEAEYLRFGSFGTYLAGDDGALTPLGSPYWNWGGFYKKVVGALVAGSKDVEHSGPEAVNYFLGMDSGVIDVILSDAVPEGTRFLAEQLRNDLIAGRLDPFRRRIAAQDGAPLLDGDRALGLDELLHMDRLCENVEGGIPAFEEIRSMSRPLVRLLGVHKEEIPPEKET